jgi:mannose-1-phosphate guanylyltransferase
MKAFLLAAGLGTRLKPITNETPKCLVQINGRPLLEWWIDLLKKHKVQEVLINLHHFPEKVVEFLSMNSNNVKFNYYYEEMLLGSAGTLRMNKEFVKGEKEFYILYADNLTNINLTEFKNFHRTHNYPFSMALFHSQNPKACGIAELNAESVITDFEEKPKEPKSDLASAGVFISSPDILELIPNNNLTDIGYDLIPKLIGKMKGWITSDYLLDIGTHQNLKKAEEEWPNVIRRSYYGL